MQKATKWAAQEAVTRILGAQAKAPPQAHGQEEGNISSTQCLQEHHATPGRQPEWKSVCLGAEHQTARREDAKVSVINKNENEAESPEGRKPLLGFARRNYLGLPSEIRY